MQDYISPEDYISPSEQAQMDADEKLPIVGHWVGLVFHWFKKKSRGITLRRFTLEPTTAAVAPIVIPIGRKIMRTATQMFWKQTGSLYFERRKGRLFMAVTAGGEYRPVPDWTMLALQPLPQTIEQLQSKEPLFYSDPVRQRRRKATPYETQLATMVCLRQMGKTWEEIGTVVGIGRHETERLAKEIETVFRDVQQLAEREQVDLERCHKLNDKWIGHNERGVQPRWSKRNPGFVKSADENDRETLIVR